MLSDEVVVACQPNRKLIDAGALVAGGPDWPVSESPNLLKGIQGLITRSDPRGRSPGTLGPDQALTREEALAVFTLYAAQAMGLAEVTGSLKVGKSADLVVLDRDIFAAPVEEIAGARVLQTWCAGTQVSEQGLSGRPSAVDHLGDGHGLQPFDAELQAAVTAVVASGQLQRWLAAPPRSTSSGLRAPPLARRGRGRPTSARLWLISGRSELSALNLEKEQLPHDVQPARRRRFPVPG